MEPSFRFHFFWEFYSEIKLPLRMLNFCATLESLAIGIGNKAVSLSSFPPISHFRETIMLGQVVLDTFMLVGVSGDVRQCWTGNRRLNGTYLFVKCDLLHWEIFFLSFLNQSTHRLVVPLYFFKGVSLGLFLLQIFPWWNAIMLHILTHIKCNRIYIL